MTNIVSKIIEMEPKVALEIEKGKVTYRIFGLGGTHMPHVPNMMSNITKTVSNMPKLARKVVKVVPPKVKPL